MATEMPIASQWRWDMVYLLGVLIGLIDMLPFVIAGLLAVPCYIGQRYNEIYLGPIQCKYAVLSIDGFP